MLRRYLAAIILIAAGTSAAACSSDDERPLRVFGAAEVAPRQLILYVDCYRVEPTFTLRETSEAVEIDNVEGVWHGEECLGEVAIELASPLGERDVVVDETQWVTVNDAERPGCAWKIGPNGLCEISSS